MPMFGNAAPCVSIEVIVSVLTGAPLSFDAVVAVPDVVEAVVDVPAAAVAAVVDVESLSLPPHAARASVSAHRIRARGSPLARYLFMDLSWGGRRPSAGAGGASRRASRHRRRRAPGRE